jgi:hypothetical protein
MHVLLIFPTHKIKKFSPHFHDTTNQDDICCQLLHPEALANQNIKAVLSTNNHHPTPQTA